MAIKNGEAKYQNAYHIDFILDTEVAVTNIYEALKKAGLNWDKSHK